MTLIRWRSLDDLLDRPPDPEPSLWGEALLPQRGLTILHSSSKQGKSMLTLNLAVAYARGDQEFLGYGLKGPGRVAIFQGEIHLRGVHERFTTMLNEPVAHPGLGVVRRSIIVNETRQLRLADKPTFEAFREFLRWWRPALVILDPLSHVLTENENDNAIVGRMLRKLATIRDDPGCAMLLVHHDGKPSEATGMRAPRQRLRGADVLNADPDSILSMVPMGQDPGFGPKSRIHFDGRYGASIEPIPVVLNEKTLWFELSKGDRGDINQLAVWIEEAGNALAEKSLLEMIDEKWNFDDGGRHRTGKKYLARALKKGVLAMKEEGGVRLYTAATGKEDDE